MNYSSTVQSFTQTETALLRLLEATKRKKTGDVLAKPVKALDAALSALFVRQGNDLVRALSPIKALLQEDAITKQFDAIFDAATENTSLAMLEALEKAYKTTLLLGATNQLAEIGIKISFSLDNKRAAHYIAQYGADQIAGIDETTKEDMRNLLQAGINNGDSYSEIARAIKARYAYYGTGVPQKHIRSRAELIAVTETGNGYQTGNYVSMQATQDAGIKMQKRWLTVGDIRVSDGCQTNQAQSWIGLNKEHSSGHLHPLRFPGCRCVELYQRDKAGKVSPLVTKPKANSDPNDIANPDVQQAINDAVVDLTKRKSFWSGIVNFASSETHMGAIGIKSGDIEINKDMYTQYPDRTFKTLVHEMFHSVSAGMRDPQLSTGIGWEEAIVEYLARKHVFDIAETAGYSINDADALKASYKTHAYSGYVNALEGIRTLTGIKADEFYPAMLGMTTEQRRAYVQKAVRANKRLTRAQANREFEQADFRLSGLRGLLGKAKK